jgi:hypothetical protein
MPHYEKYSLYKCDMHNPGRNGGKQEIMSQENNNTSNRGLASADEETKERVAKPRGEARA